MDEGALIWSKECLILLSDEGRELIGIVSCYIDNKKQQKSAQLSITCADGDLHEYILTPSDMLHSYHNKVNNTLEIKLSQQFEIIRLIIKDDMYIAIQTLLQQRILFIPAFIDASVFYNNNHNKPSEFRIFNTQNQAFDYFDGITHTSLHNVKVYTFETIMGKRKFLVSIEDEFLSRYAASGMRISRHVYEIIRDNYPCRLYFDIEFHIPSNEDINGNELTNYWCLLVSWKLYERYQIKVGADDIIELDSTSSEKFSRHIMIILPNNTCSNEILFLNNKHVGNFVQSLVKDLMESSKDTLAGADPMSNNKYQRLWVNSRDGKKTFIVDLGVYTRNRAFRLFQSCKYGKTSYLKRHNNASLKGVNRHLEPSAEVKLGSHHRTLLYKHILRKTYVVPYNVFPVELPIDIKGTKRRVGSATKEGHTYLMCWDGLEGDGHYHEVTSSAVVNNPAFVTSTSREISPFPLLDHAVRALVNRGGIQGEVRQWSWRNKKITYHIDKNKWCHNINRSHKSNGIMINVDLELGFAYQTCWDIDCKGFRSEGIPLSKDILPNPDVVEALYVLHTTSS
jgi:hypothetical protein